MGNQGQTAISDAFAALVRPQIGDEDIDLVRAALTIARTEYPELNIESYVVRVDELARNAATRISDVGDAIETIAALNHTLFEEAGLRGPTPRTLTKSGRLHFLSAECSP
jgi:regulator of sirC expression with transglutaminase-like and TPR domain